MFRRRKRTEDPVTEDQINEAREALKKVERRDRKAQAEGSEIMEVVREIKSFQRRNNFTAMIREALQGTGHRA